MSPPQDNQNPNPKSSPNSNPNPYKGAAHRDTNDTFDPFDPTLSIDTTGITFDEDFTPLTPSGFLLPPAVLQETPSASPAVPKETAPAPARRKYLIPASMPAAYFTDESDLIRVPVIGPYRKRPTGCIPGSYPPELLINGLPLINASYIRAGADEEEVLSEPEKDGLAVPRAPAPTPSVEEQLIRLLGKRGADEIEDGEASVAKRRAGCGAEFPLDEPARYGVTLDASIVAQARRRRRLSERKK
jgi:hypothetical protein